MCAVNQAVRSSVELHGVFYCIVNTFEHVRDHIIHHDGNRTTIEDLFTSLYAVMRQHIVDWDTLIENPEGHGYLTLDEFFLNWGVGPTIIPIDDDEETIVSDITPIDVTELDQLDLEQMMFEVIHELEMEDMDELSYSDTDTTG